MFQSIHQSNQSSDNAEDEIKAKKKSILDPNEMMHGYNRSMQIGGPQDPANSGGSNIAQAMFNEEEEPVQGKAIQKAEEEEEVQMKESSTDSTQSASSGSSTQSSLPKDVNARMEASFGANFSNVNIHTNDTKATQMKALAFTQGNNVHFAPGQYNPNTSKGQELIGHEYTHVVQQGAGRVAPTRQAKGMAINDNPALENEADVMGKKAAEGKSVDVSGKGSSNSIQRKTKQDVVSGISKYDKYIEAASIQYGISINQIKAIIAVESGGNPNASSGAAWGLMQIVKPTWDGAQKKYPELNSYDFDSYWDNPEINILFGTAVFKGKMKTVGVDASDENFASIAITAYNAGEGTVKTAMKKAKEAGSKEPTKDCLKPEYLKASIKYHKIYSYYLTGKGKSANKTKTEKEAIDLKYKEISKYPGKVNEYLAILNGEKKETTTDKNPNQTEAKDESSNGAIGTYLYIVESGKGNAMIASLFGISQKNIEDANKELHAKRGGKGYFFPKDKIIIPNPTKNLNKLIAPTENKEQNPEKDTETKLSGINFENLSKGALWAANPLLMGSLKLGQYLYNSVTGEPDVKSTQNADEKKTETAVEDSSVYNEQARTDAINFIKQNKYAYLKGHENWVNGTFDGKKYNQVIIVHKSNSEDVGKHIKVYRNFDFKKRYYHFVDKEELTDEQYKTETNAMFQNKKDKAAEKGKTLTKHNTETYCNIATTAIAEYYGATNLQYHKKLESNANSMYDRLNSGFYNNETHEYKNIGFKQAESYAKSGGFSIVVIKEKKTGHIGTLTGGYGGDGKENVDNLNIFQAGSSFGAMTYAQGFGKDKLPEFYIWQKKSGGEKKKDEEVKTEEVSSKSSESKVTAPISTPVSSNQFVVPSGWGLNKIAKHLGVSVEALKESNADKLKTWKGGVQGFVAGASISIPSSKRTSSESNSNSNTENGNPQNITPEETITKLFVEYKTGKLSMPDLGRMLIPYVNSHTTRILAIFKILPSDSRDNLAYAITANSTKTQLNTFPKTLLESMKLELGGFLNTTSWKENWKQKDRIEEALGATNTISNTVLDTENNEKTPTKEQAPQVESVSTSECWDSHSNARIGKIHSKVKANAFKFINTLDKVHNIKVRVTQGLRTIDEQNALYNKGRDSNGKVIDKSKIVTNAKGGQSFHNFGLAIDVVEIKGGQALWSNPNWKTIGEVGKACGFEWGGDWASFVDKPHFQNDLGYSLSQLQTLNSEGKWNL